MCCHVTPCVSKTGQWPEPSVLSVVIILTLKEKLQFMTALGAGLLIGAALVVIIPEGVEAVYSRRHTAESAGDHRLHDRSFKEPSLAEPPAPHAG